MTSHDAPTPDIPDAHDPMQQALALAAHALYISNPNPRVGCVIVAHDGHTVLGSGFTQRAGGPHAEVMALRDAAARNHDVRSATAYVTLEPCSHHGRTGPCCDALIAAGIGHVVGAILDPNPRVAGQGFERLRAAGVTVDIDARAGKQSRALNIGFFSRMVRKQPWVRLKAGMSLDGATALANGESQWITGEAARADAHHWRARACAILTGVGTMLADDPLLNVRNIDTPRQPRLVIVDSQLRTPPVPRRSPCRAKCSFIARIRMRHAARPWKPGAPRSSSCRMRTDASTCRPCCRTWVNARSTNCMWKPEEH